MNILNVTKQPWDRKDYDIDASQWLSDGDAIASSTKTVQCLTNTEDAALIVDEPIVSSPRIKLWVEGGTDLEKYKITVRFTTTAGRRLECEITVFVKDE